MSSSSSSSSTDTVKKCSLCGEELINQWKTCDCSVCGHEFCYRCWQSTGFIDLSSEYCSGDYMCDECRKKTKK